MIRGLISKVTDWRERRKAWKALDAHIEASATRTTADSLDRELVLTQETTCQFMDINDTPLISNGMELCQAPDNWRTWTRHQHAGVVDKRIVLGRPLTDEERDSVLSQFAHFPE